MTWTARLRRPNPRPPARMTERRFAPAARRAGAVLLAFAAALGACSSDGGVVGSGGTGTTPGNGEVGTVAVGPITGFGSIIVNGIRYDDSTASLSTDDDGRLSRPDLRLGMTVEVRGSADPVTGSGTANAVAVRSELRGLVQERGTGGFQLLGVTVRTGATTVFDNVADVGNGDFVEVHGTMDSASRVLVASRIEKKTPGEFKLRGIIAGLDAGAKRFAIGPVPIDYRDAGPVAGLADGTEVQVRGPAPDPAGWRVSRVVVRYPLSLASASRVELEAVIESFASLSDFRLAGLVVDGSAASIEGGSPERLRAGVRVELKGEVRGTTVRATRIRLEDGDDGNPGQGGGQFKVKGRIESFASPASFVVRGTRVDASGSVEYDDGGAGRLAPGVCVEVEGTLAASPVGSTLRARRIKFDDC